MFAESVYFMIKIGLIGSGSVAQSHIEVLRQIEGFDIVGIYSKNQSRIKEIFDTYNIPSFSSAEKLIETVDAIDITSITRAHHDLIVNALKSSKHVYIENPITNTPEEADHIIKIAEEANVTVQVSQSNRFNPAFILANQHIYDPQYIEINRKNNFSLLNKEVSIVLGSMVKDIDILLGILKSKIRRIKTIAVDVLTTRHDLVNVRIEFDNNAIANLTTNGISDEHELEVNVFQRNRHIFIDLLRYKTSIARLKSDIEKVNLFNFTHDELIVDKPEIKPNNPLKDELVSFYNSIITHSTSLQTLEERFDALRIAHEILLQINNKKNYSKEETSPFSSIFFGSN